MIENVQIQNYKSLENLSLHLGRVNVFIGENGAGKSNILEAIALGAAAESNKLDNEFLASRGVRVSSAALMRSGFQKGQALEPISIAVRSAGNPEVRYNISNDNKPYSNWELLTEVHPRAVAKLADAGLEDVLLKLDKEERLRIINEIRAQFEDQVKSFAAADGKRRSLKIEFTVKTDQKLYSSEDMSDFQDFLIYSPENSSLRTFEREGQIQPLGINGEGLLRFLEVASADKDQTTIEAIKDSLRLFEWFQDFEIKKKRSTSQMNILDQFLDKSSSTFDQRSANEGFLFVAFYMSILSSNLTPRFFAIDNVDTALNPKLCQEVVRRIARLAKKNEKQVVLTTHNPAALDGLDLTDDEQRLFVISRNAEGRTRVRRFQRKPATGEPSRLSELFIRGALGGLPKGF